MKCVCGSKMEYSKLEKGIYYKCPKCKTEIFEQNDSKTKDLNSNYTTTYYDKS